MEYIDTFELAIRVHFDRISVTSNNEWRVRLVKNNYLYDFVGEQGTRLTDKAEAELDEFPN